MAQMITGIEVIRNAGTVTQTRVMTVMRRGRTVGRTLRLATESRIEVGRQVGAVIGARIMMIRMDGAQAAIIGTMIINPKARTRNAVALVAEEDNAT